jgi:hypothetical protein
MTHKGQQGQKTTGTQDTATRLQATQSIEIQKSLKKLYRRYGKYAVPVHELREMLDTALGD